jgi:PAS domain S-box-containing protein
MINNFSPIREINQRDNYFFKKMISNLPDLVFQLSYSSSGILTFPFFNKAVINYFELTKEQVRNFNITTVFREKIHPDDFDAMLISLQKLNENQSNWSFEFRAILPSKGLRWFKAVANVEHSDFDTILMTGRMSDITVEKQLEVDLKVSEQRFQFAMEASTKGVWDLNLKTNKVFYSSQSMKMLELEENDVVDFHQKWDDRIHPDDINDYQKEFELHINNQTPYYENVKRMLTKSGNYKWILSRGKVIERDLNGNPLRIIGTHTDITQQKEEEKALKKTLEIINEQNSRLLNFAHIVSHNLNSHTSNFKMLLDLVEEENDQNSIAEIFQYLRTSSNALHQTIEHLKELVDINNNMSLKKEKLNLDSYLNKVLAILGEEINSNKVKIYKKIPKDYSIPFNPSYLESILLNFTTNAIKYSHPDRIPEIYYDLEKENDKFVLKIKDNGLGIDLDRHGEKLFGMYKTFHNNPDARGIGLFITKNQIESMGGKVEVESKKNIGTTFKIFFNNEI